MTEAESGTLAQSGFHVPPRHKPPRKSGLVLQAMLLVMGATTAYVAYINFAYLHFLESVRAGEYISQAGYFDNAEPIEELFASMPSAMNGSFLFAALSYLVFVYCAATNLENARAVDFRLWPNGAVFFSLIPIANFYLIYYVIRVIWVASRNPLQGKEEPSSQLVLGWVFFLAGVLGTRVVDNMFVDALTNEDLERATNAAWLNVAATTSVVVSVILLTIVVRDIVRGQARWREASAQQETRASGAPATA